MAILSKQIGWSQKANLIYELIKQTDRLNQILPGNQPSYGVRRMSQMIGWSVESKLYYEWLRQLDKLTQHYGCPDCTTTTTTTIAPVTDFNFRVYTNNISAGYNNLLIILSGFYPLTVDWGDGTIETLPASDIFSLDHVYSTLDYYTISIKNTGASSVTFALQQVPVDTVNNINDLFDLTTSANMFINYCNITSDEVNNILGQFVFYNIYNSTNIDLSNNTPPAPPTGQGIIDKATLISGGANVTTD